MAKHRSPSEEMFDILLGRWVCHLIYLAARLGIADHLEDGPRTVDELASKAGVRAPALYRVLRALASVRVFAEIKDNRFKLTPLAATLRKNAPGSMRAIAIMVGENYREDAWRSLLDGLKTGEPPFLKANGVSLFQYYEKHPEDFQIFSEAMTNLSSIENLVIAAAYKFTKIGTLVDVGGGHGSLLAALLRANPKLKGVLFDLPSVVAGAEQEARLRSDGFVRRCRFESGSFFEAVPQGADAYIIKRVLHDWDDDRCAKILANCRATMPKNGKVFAVDTVIPPGNGPERGKLFDIQMLIFGGRERTKKDFAALFTQAGLKLTRVVPTKCPLSIVEGVRL